MRVEAIELVRVHLPLKHHGDAAHGAVRAKDAVLVRLCTDAVDGWGECVALAAPTYSHESADSAELVLEQHLVPRLAARLAPHWHVPGEPDAPDALAAAVRDALADVRGNPMARAALEIAAYDAGCAASGVSFAAAIGARPGAHVAAGAVVGLRTHLDDLLADIDALVRTGYRRVKVKIAPGRDLDVLRTVRAAFPSLALVADANGAYTADAGSAADAAADLDGGVRNGRPGGVAVGPRVLPDAIDEIGLLCLEQPLAPDDLVGHARLARRLATPVCLDEALGSLADLDAALELGSCAVVNLKAGRVGGVFESLRIAARCRTRGVGLWCGGMYETGIGRAVNVALASLDAMSQPGDLSASDRYFDVDVTEPFLLRDGALTVPSAPGLGVQPLPDALAPVTVRRRLLSLR